MGDPRNNELVHIPENRFKGLALERWLGRKRSANLPCLNLGQDWKRLDTLIVISDPIHYSSAILAELFWGHVETLLFRHLSFSSIE
jgi:hypothetical protein